MYVCMHACMHTYIHTCMHACMHAYIHTYIHAYIHAYMHNIHTYIHTYIHAYIHTYIHTYILELRKGESPNSLLMPSFGPPIIDICSAITVSDLRLLISAQRLQICEIRMQIAESISSSTHLVQSHSSTNALKPETRRLLPRPPAFWSPIIDFGSIQEIYNNFDEIHCISFDF